MSTHLPRTKSPAAATLLLLAATILATPAGAVTVDYTNIGTFTATALDLGGITVTGSGTINVLNLNGLGIVGGANNALVDGTEIIRFSFNDGPAIDVSYFLPIIGNLNGNQLLGERFLTAFDASGNSLGTIKRDWAGGYQVNALFGGVPISGFSLRADVDSFRVSSVSYTTVPGPSPLLLLGTGLLALAWRRRTAGPRPV